MANEYAVIVSITGTAKVFTIASSEEEAREKVDSGDFSGGEILDWEVEETTDDKVGFLRKAK